MIGFREFPTPRTAPEIASLIIQVLNEFQLCNKIFSVAFDNAPANTASISDLIAVVVRLSMVSIFIKDTYVIF